MFFYTIRKGYIKQKGNNPRVILSIIRLLLGFIIPLILYQLTGTDFVILIFVSVVLGEFIDRCEFYHEFELLTPDAQMKNDLEIMLKKNSGTRSILMKQLIK